MKFSAKDVKFATFCPEENKSVKNAHGCNIVRDSARYFLTSTLTTMPFQITKWAVQERSIRTKLERNSNARLLRNRGAWGSGEKVVNV